MSQKKPLKNNTETSELLEGVKENNIIMHPYDGPLLCPGESMICLKPKADITKLRW